MKDYTGLEPESKQSNFDHFTEQAGDVVTKAFQVKLAWSPTNEIRLTWSPQPSTAQLPWAEGAESASGRSASEALVYTDELQPLATVDEKPKKRRLQKELTSYAKRKIKGGCAVIKQTAERPGAFLTATVPGGTKEAIKAVSENSAALMNNLMEKLRKAHKRFFDEKHCEIPPFLCTTVWEPQKRGMLHLHTAFACDDSELYKYVKANWQKWWRQVLENLSDEIGVDLFQRKEGGTWRNMDAYPIVECRRIKKDVGRYLSKYMTKGVEDSQDTDDDGLTRWWYMSRQLADLVKFDSGDKKIPAQCQALAEKLALETILVAMPFEPDVMTMKHPKFGTACGVVLYVQEKDKEHVLIKMAEVLESKGNEFIRASWCLNEKGEFWWDGTTTPGDYFGTGDEDWDTEDIEESADLCAPFSASEKGGGMR